MYLCYCYFLSPSSLFWFHSQYSNDSGLYSVCCLFNCFESYILKLCCLNFVQNLNVTEISCQYISDSHNIAPFNFSKTYIVT